MLCTVHMRTDGEFRDVYITTPKAIEEEQNAFRAERHHTFMGRSSISLCVRSFREPSEFIN